MVRVSFILPIALALFTCVLTPVIPFVMMSSTVTCVMGCRREQAQQISKLTRHLSVPSHPSL